MRFTVAPTGTYKSTNSLHAQGRLWKNGKKGDLNPLQLRSRPVNNCKEKSFPLQIQRERSTHGQRMGEVVPKDWRGGETSYSFLLKKSWGGVS